MLMLSASLAALLLGAAAVIHAVWAVGSAWPARDGKALANAVIDRDEMPGRAACLAVVTLLTAAGAIVLARAAGGSFWGPEWVVRLGAWVVAGVLLARGLLGLTTSLLARERRIYQRLDAAIYSPLCLLIALLIVPVARA